MAAFLDLADVRIRSSGIIPPVPEGPGYAYLPREGDLVLGENAVALAKLHPTRINNRYLAELNTEPTSPDHPKVRHNADLAWHQLKLFKEESNGADIYLLVPSSYVDETLKLLAGICQSLEFNVQAFINRSIAGCLFDVESKAVHIELQQNQTLLTFVEKSAGHLNTLGHEKLSAFGLARLQEHWLHALRQRFISSYRFDPMHSGDTEQQLFSQLHEKIGGNLSAPFDFSVTNNGQQYTERFSDQELSAPFQELLAEIQAKSQGLPLVMDSYFGGIPGADSVEDQIILAPDAYFAGALAMTQNLVVDAHENAIYLDSADIDSSTPNQQPLNHPSGSPGQASQESHDQHATHLLVGACAYPAAEYDICETDQQLTLVTPEKPGCSHISFSQGTLQTGEKASELRLNNAATSAGQPLAPGDNISTQKVADSITAISVRVTET